MLKKLRNRLLLVNMIALSIVIITAFAVIYGVTYSSAMQEIDRKMHQVPVYVLHGADNNGGYPLILGMTSEDDYRNDILDGSSGENPNLPLDYSSSFSIYLDSNDVPFGMWSFLDIPTESYIAVMDEIKAGGQTTGRVDFEGRLWQYAYSYPQVSDFPQSIGGLMDGESTTVKQVIFVDITDTTTSLARLAITLVVAGIVVLVLLFSISFYFANRSIRPIEESWGKQKQFVADASHELKTPIAIIGANIDALEANGSSTVDSQKKWIGYARQELGRMSKLIGDLLYLAQSENAKSDALDFDLGKIALEVSTSMEAVLFEKQIRFVEEVAQGVMVNGDEGKIKQAILILLDNAAKYTEQSGWIKLSLVKDKNWARLSVQNSGPGISPTDMAVIFDRFYRPDQSRSTESGGYGLGLSIFKTIIERAGGKIAAQSNNGVTEFSFSLRTEK